MFQKRRWLGVAVFIPLAACRDRAHAPTVEHSQGASPLQGGTLVNVDEHDDGSWPMATGDYRNTRYSSLNQINAGNAAQLQLAFSVPMKSSRGEEAAPLVVDGTMYVVGPFPNEVFALDLTRPNAPPKWTYRPPVEPAAQGVACCDFVTRGAAFCKVKSFSIHSTVTPSLSTPKPASNSGTPNSAKST